ncbi:MAG: S-layer homology domain-containing protein [Clostridia bacterium]
MKRKLLSVLLTFCLAFSLLPTAALAEGEGAPAPAEVPAAAGIVLPEAADGVITLDNGAYVMSGDTTATIKVPNGKNATLDLNGKTLTNKTGEHTIIVENGATLTITGNGIVDNVSHGKGAIVNSGEVTLNGGTFKRSAEKGTYSPNGNGGNSWYTIANYGTMEINTGVTVENAGGYSSMIRNGGDVTADCNLTIEGGNFAGGINTVKNDSFGVLTINGGNFSNTAQYVIMNWNKAEITAGTFRTLDTASAVLFTSAYGGDANTIGKLSISGGEFKHASDTQEMIVDHYDETNKGNAVVTGGKFDADISKYIPTDYVQSADGTVEKLGETNAVAKVGDTYYKTLADAVAAADNNTVTLLKDVTADITIPAGKTMTLDLNGKTLTNVNDHTILNNGNLTITGTGKVDNISHAKGALYNKGTVVVNGGTFDRSKENGKTSNDSGSNSWYTIKNVGSMTIHDGATVQTAGNNTTLGKFSSLVSNGYFDANDYSTNKGLDQPILTIDGGTFRGGLNTIKNDDRAKLTINGGTFSNYYQAVVQNHNIAEITGGTFTAASDANAETYGIYNCGCGAEIDLGTLTVSGGTFTGATYAVAEVSSLNAAVNISGGQFAGTKAAIVKSSTSKATIAVSGGKFSSDPSVYVVGNGNTNIVKRDGSEGAYTYTVLAKSGLTSGVYLTNPSGALASNYYVSSTANGVWTVSYSAPYSGGSSSYDPTYSVSTPSKTEHGTVTVSPKSASKGDRVTVTVKPDSGYVLETLTVTDKNGNELTLKDKGNGKYTFTMPAGKVEVKATFMEDNSMLNFFYDVPNNAYFYEAVKWAVENGITTGVGNDLFAPEQPCTRAQIVTFLWRAAGSPEPKGAASGMTDVVSGSYYEKAVAWAIENGITTGTTTSTFSPDATCTRAQAVTFLARALKAKAASAAEFSDVPTGSYFADAVAWAAANGVTEGIGGGLFGSDNDCTRGQIVTFLYRAYNK